MRKIITLIIVLITYTSFSQVTPVVDTTITDEILTQYQLLKQMKPQSFYTKYHLVRLTTHSLVKN
jgi:hypothetical protein